MLHYKNIILILLLISFSFGQKVACIGNSLTAGCYPQYIDNMYDVRDYGVSGASLIKGNPMPYWNTQAFVDVINWNPDYVVILLCTNDIMPLYWNADKYEHYYNEFVKNFNGKMFIGTIPYWIPKEDKQSFNNNIDEANAIIRTMVLNYYPPLTLLDFNSLLQPEDYQSDGIHFNASGQMKMAQLVDNELSATLAIEEYWDAVEDYKNQRKSGWFGCQP